jgi:hypothetical protein
MRKFEWKKWHNKNEYYVLLMDIYEVFMGPRQFGLPWEQRGKKRSIQRIDIYDHFSFIDLVSSSLRVKVFGRSNQTVWLSGGNITAINCQKWVMFRKGGKGDYTAEHDFVTQTL